MTLRGLPTKSQQYQLLTTISMIMCNLFKSLVCGFIYFILFVFIAPAAYAQSSSGVQVTSIVLSKNCPIADTPEAMLKSIDDPNCPQKGETQLIQATIANHSERPRRLGIEVEITRNGKKLMSALPRVVRHIRSFDEVRVLHSYPLNETGSYRISARVWDAETQKLVLVSGPGVNRKFFIPSSADIEAAQAKIQEQEELEAAQQAKPLEFDPPDLRWEEIHIIPKHVLRGEKFRVRLELINVGGDIIRNASARVDYYNVRLPLRKTTIATPQVDIMAPGETITFELDYTLPDDQLLGEYKLLAVVDPENIHEEANEENNEKTSVAIKLSDIKLHIPADQFVFEENGLFLFQWDSFLFGEFKIQVGVDENFEDVGMYFDLPQGDRWIADKELVPLAGELPQMALGLMRTFEKNVVYWRVVGRKADKTQATSDTRRFSIKPAYEEPF